MANDNNFKGGSPWGAPPGGGGGEREEADLQGPGASEADSGLPGGPEQELQWEPQPGSGRFSKQQQPDDEHQHRHQHSPHQHRQVQYQLAR